MAVRTALALPITDDQRVGLERIARSSTLPHRKVVRAKALLWAADGVDGSVEVEVRDLGTWQPPAQNRGATAVAGSSSSAASPAT